MNMNKKINGEDDEPYQTTKVTNYLCNNFYAAHSTKIVSVQIFFFLFLISKISVQILKHCK